MPAGLDPVYSKLQHGVAIAFLSLILLTATEVFSRFGITTVLWIIIYAGSLLYIIFDYQRFLSNLILSWPALLIPLFALLSTLWSEAPGWSLYASIQLLYTTFIAIWVATRFRPAVVFQALLIATGIAVGLSVINEYVQFIDPYQPRDYEGAPQILIGVFTQKNVFGKSIDLLVFALLIVGLMSRKLIPAYIVALILFVPLYKSQSVASILVYLVTLGLPVYWFMLKQKQQRLFRIMIGWIVFLMVLFTVIALDINLIDMGLDTAGKDSTLTGRTMIWSIGMTVFQENPLLGVGYQAFWQPGVFQEVNSIRSSMHGQEINGFHSAYIEVLVALGLIGLLIFLFLLIYNVYQNIRWFTVVGSIESFGAVFFVISTIIAASFDVIVFRQHEIFYILMIVFLVMSHRAVFNNP